MNNIKLNGVVKSEPTFSHSSKGEDFFKFELEVIRKSGNLDILNCVIPSCYADRIKSDDSVELDGEIRTRNEIVDEETGKKRLVVYIFVKEVNEFIGYQNNEAVVYGYICKKPVYRTTPSGREICDLIIASNRASGRSDYIPTIAWGRTAERLSALDVGTGIEVHGRMQSREYTKVLDDGSSIEKIAYELSVLYATEWSGVNERSNY